VKLEVVRSASKEFLITRETATILPSLPAFARLIDATIGLYHTIDPEEKGTLGMRVFFGLLRLVLTIVGDMTMFWKRRIRG
jgi:hypothetical protein